jgi:site-specific recombinase XerD
MTIGEAYALYREALPGLEYAPGTRGNYLWNLHPFLAWIQPLGLNNVNAIEKAHIEAYQRSLARGPLRKATQGLRIRALKRWFEWLVAQGHLFQSPAEGIVEAPKGWREPPRIPTREEINRMLESQNTSQRAGVRNRALLELLLSTGIGRFECEALDLKHVDLAAGVVRIGGRRGRVVPLRPEALRWVKLYVDAARPFYSKRNPIERAFFLDRQGRRLRGPKIHLVLKTVARRTGMPKGAIVRALRHSFAARAIAEGGDVAAVQKLLGHRERRSTRQAYGKLLGHDR